MATRAEALATLNAMDRALIAEYDLTSLALVPRDLDDLTGDWLLEAGLINAASALPPRSVTGPNEVVVDIQTFVEGRLRQLTGLGTDDPAVAIEPHAPPRRAHGGDGITDTTKPGTVTGAISLGADKERYLLTSAHVLSPAKKQTVYTYSLTKTYVGVADRTEVDAAVEVALARILNPHVRAGDSRCFKSVPAVGSSVDGRPVYLCGAANRVSTRIGAWIATINTPNGYFQDQIRTPYVAEGGDSGGLLVDTRVGRSIGLAMYSGIGEKPEGGISGTTSYFNKMSNVMSLLGADSFY